MSSEPRGARMVRFWGAGINEDAWIVLMVGLVLCRFQMVGVASERELELIGADQVLDRGDVRCWGSVFGQWWHHGADDFDR